MSKVQKGSEVEPINEGLAEVNFHPIESGSYIIPTPEIEFMFEKIYSWISKRAPGGIVYGRPRIGKSRALKFIVTHLPKIYGDELAVFSVRCKKHSVANDNTFYQEILSDLKHRHAKSGKAVDKRERIVNFFIEQGQRTGVNRVILFLDEAHRLTSTHYDWLMDIYNDLDAADVNFTLISVGQKELIDLRSTFLHTKKSQIIGRFMVHEHQYLGIKNQKEIKKCLNGYDESEYPEYSGCSYTRFYFPDAFDQGERISVFSSELFKIFKELRQEYNLPQKFDIPMQYLASTVEFVFKQYGARGEGVYWPTVEQWKSAVKESGYLESEVLMDVIGDSVG